MEAKLKEYRALRRRREIIDKTKEKLEESKQTILKFITPKIFNKMEKNKEEVLLINYEEELDIANNINEVEDSLENAEVIESEPIVEKTQESWRYFIIKWSIYSVIWVTLYIYFIFLQFGAVFFGISLLIGIFLNTRTSPKKKGEVSAYSVFNENCTSIDGTLNAEQLQKEMMFGGRLF